MVGHLAHRVRSRAGRMDERHWSDILDIHPDAMVGKAIIGTWHEEDAARICRLCRPNIGLLSATA